MTVATSEPVVLQGITQQDIQRLLQQTVNEFTKKKGSGAIAFDTSYLYNFHPDDFQEIRHLNLLGRYKPELNIEWHRQLERWYNDQTVLNRIGRPIKPIQIVRQFDKIVNEGLEAFAQAIVGGTGDIYKFHAIGIGEDLTQAFAADTTLVDEVSRIDVTDTDNGGSISRDGSTIYIIGNHPITLATCTITESGIFNSALTTNDLMLDHSVYDPGIVHDQGEDGFGGTTVIYMCGL